MTKQETLERKIIELVVTKAKSYVLETEIRCLSKEVKKARKMAASNTFENIEI